jgi:PhnB protein
MAVKPVPEGYHTITPYMVANDAQKLIDFATRAFDAKLVEEMRRPDGGIMHAELQIGDSRIMLGQANEQHTAMPCGIYLYVPDTDATYTKALAAGAVSAMEPANQFYGDRNAGVRDENGNVWWIGTHVEDVPPDELKKRAAEEMMRREAAAQRA